MLYHLTFDDFCDWYAEAIKPRLYDGDADARATALAALERLLKLLHPVMPHVTEEIWSNLSGARVAADRRVRGRTPARRGRRRARSTASRRRRRSSGGAGCVVPLEGDEKRIFDVVVKPERVRRRTGNVEAERERLRKEIARAEGMLANERFVSNAPPEVVEAEREKLSRYRRELDRSPV